MQVHVEGQTLEVESGATVGSVLKQVLSGKKFKTVVAANITKNDQTTLIDLTYPLTQEVQVEPVYLDSEAGLTIVRHSTSHVMACAVKHLFPKALVTIGPAINTGFYYDFDVERPFSVEDLAAIEEEMQKIVAAKAPFTRTEMTKEDAIKHFSDLGETYKVELIQAIDAPTVSFYTCADFTDLCRGPHVPDTGFCQAFKLLSVAGAYWHGDEHNPMLSRIYGTAFGTSKELSAYLKQLE